MMVTRCMSLTSTAIASPSHSDFHRASYLVTSCCLHKKMIQARGHLGEPRKSNQQSSVDSEYANLPVFASVLISDGRIVTCFLARYWVDTRLSEISRRGIKIS